MTDHPIPMIPDIQSLNDTRQKPIDQVGIRGLKHRLTFTDTGDETLHHTIAMSSLYVELPQHKKGTHMSRFVEFINERLTALSLADFPGRLVEMTEKMEARSGFMTLAFPFFVEKQAPVSQAVGAVDYDIRLTGAVVDGQTRQQLQVIVPLTTLCPCSKEISAYGAHNQRSYITLTAIIDRPVSLKGLISAIEQQGSCEVYSLLKRPDEKYVTEYAYDHPKFVEDMVRDLATMLDGFEGIVTYRIESENIESIHNHSAYAMIQNGQSFIDIK